MAELAVGRVRLYDEVRTALAAGAYRIRTGTAVHSGGAPLEPAPDHLLAIEVTAPRFRLDATDVLACQPPRDFQGDVRTRLAHIALTRRTLPWERRLAEGTPWMALLVLAEDEATVDAERPLRAAVGEEMFVRLAASDPIDGDGPLVSILRVADPAVLAGIWPTRRDVRLLTHVRHVNLADSELAGADDDGWIAVVTANRLPARPGRWTANLVSLEAQEALWDGAAAPAPPLIVLHRWGFEVSAGGGFEDLAAGLSIGLIGAPDADAAVTLTREARDGTSHQVRYRGPLAPFPRGDNGAPGPLPDITTAAARELGRLLAAADGRFLRALVSWQRAAQLAETQQAYARPLTAALDGLSAPEARRGGAPHAAEPAPASLDDIRRAAVDRLRATAAPPADTYGARTVTAP